METRISITNPAKGWLKNSITFKLILITILAFLLLIPSSWIQKIIRERESNRDEAIYEVSSKWGTDQLLGGPVLSIPYKVTKQVDDEIQEFTRHAHFLPTKLLIDGEVNTETLHRGIYDIVLYNSDLSFSGNFEKPDFQSLNIAEEQVMWKEAFISVGIPDMSGIKDEMKLTWNYHQSKFQSGIPIDDVYRTGVYSKVMLTDSTKEYAFNFTLDLNGSNSLSFVPMGRYTEVTLHSPWPDPSFNGNFLPDEREVTKDGFKARWSLFDLNRNIPNQWVGERDGLFDSVFGVRLLLTVDEYQKNLRSSKYSLLIISLTFLIFFLSEVINKKQMHPFQYTLAGLALVVFYILLLSLSEHVGFNLSYLISALLTGTLITFYTSAVFRSTRFTAIMGSFFAVVYSFTFVVLQLEDFSLLAGALGLFIALATTMYLTRKIDWYNLSKSEGPDSNGEPAAENE